LTEALVTELAQVRELRVISRTSVMTYKGTTKRLAEIARELNVDAVVEGSVARTGDDVSVTASLSRRATPPSKPSS
jgi:TolB-like protein